MEEEEEEGGGLMEFSVFQLAGGAAGEEAGGQPPGQGEHNTTGDVIDNRELPASILRFDSLFGDIYIGYFQYIKISFFKRGNFFNG